MSDESSSSTTESSLINSTETPSTDAAPVIDHPAADAPATDDAAKDDGKADGAPEEYAEFKIPDGVEMDKTLLEGFTPLAKELNLTQEQAQKLVDYYSTQILVERMEKWAGVQKEWVDTSKADKEFGGTEFNANMAFAKAALDKFGTNELKGFLDQYGAGNHPEVVRFFYRVGKAISEPGHVSGGPTQNTGVTAATYYDNSNMK